MRATRNWRDLNAGLRVRDLSPRARHVVFFSLVWFGLLQPQPMTLPLLSLGARFGPGLT